MLPTPPHSSAPNNEKPRKPSPATWTPSRAPVLSLGKEAGPLEATPLACNTPHQESTREARAPQDTLAPQRSRQGPHVGSSSPWRMPRSRSAEMFPEARPQPVILRFFTPVPPVCGQECSVRGGSTPCPWSSQTPRGGKRQRSPEAPPFGATRRENISKGT